MQPGSPAYDARLRQWCADLDRIAATVRRPVPTCEGCRHFVPNTINPNARHRCRQREDASHG
jgi:hypothetical protein